jgi:hypothetical protein
VSPAGRCALSAAALAAALACPPVFAQGGAARTLELENGPSIAFTLYVHPENAHLLGVNAVLAPYSALNAAKLLNGQLANGDLEEAAVLSNSPRRRFEVLRDYLQSVGEEEFKKVFAQYSSPENRVLAEIAIENRRLLIWELRAMGGPTPHLAGQYFVEVEGRFLLDDVPSEARSELRRVLEAYRAGKIPR